MILFAIQNFSPAAAPKSPPEVASAIIHTCMHTGTETEIQCDSKAIKAQTAVALLIQKLAERFCRPLRRCLVFFPVFLFLERDTFDGRAGPTQEG